MSWCATTTCLTNFRCYIANMKTKPHQTRQIPHPSRAIQRAVRHPPRPTRQSSPHSRAGASTVRLTVTISSTAPAAETFPFSQHPHFRLLKSEISNLPVRRPINSECQSARHSDSNIGTLISAGHDRWPSENTWPPEIRPRKTRRKHQGQMVRRSGHLREMVEPLGVLKKYKGYSRHGTIR